MWSAQTDGEPVPADEIADFFAAKRTDVLAAIDEADREAAEAQYDACVRAVAEVLAAHVGSPSDPVTVGLSGSVNQGRVPGDGPGEVITIKVVAPDPATYSSE